MFFLVGYKGVSTVIETDVIKVTVSDPPVSAWDPKLLFVQLVVALSVMGVGYWISNTYITPYFEEQQLRGSKKDEKSTTKSGVAAGPKGYDESWIPPHHLNANKKTKKTK